MEERRSFDLADGGMLLTAAIWATNNVLVKTALGEISPLAYVFGRFAIVVGLLFAWLRLTGALRRPEPADYGRFLLAGLSGYTAYNVLFTVGLDHTSAFSAALLISVGPLFTLLFASLLGIERVRRGQWLGVALACLGIGVFVWDRRHESGSAVGNALSLAGAASFAIYSLATRPLVRRYGSPLVTAWSVLIGLVGVIPIALPATLREGWGDVSRGAWASLVYSAAVSMLIAYSLWGWAIARRGIGRTVLYLYLVPILTGLIAATFLGETFGPRKLAGAVLVLGGVALARRVGTHRAPLAPPARDTIEAPVAGPAPRPAPGP